jgi:hypothetical protein
LNRARFAQHNARLREQGAQRRRELEAKKLLATRRAPL